MRLPLFAAQLEWSHLLPRLEIVLKRALKEFTKSGRGRSVFVEPRAAAARMRGRLQH